MKLAFCLFKHNVYGGLEHDFTAIARACQSKGHIVHAYAMQWLGNKPDFMVNLIFSKGYTNHSRCLSYVKNLRTALTKKNYDGVIGFNRMPGLDIYYAADICYAYQVNQKHGRWYHYLPRYKVYSAFEKAVFAPDSKTQIMTISAQQKAHYLRYYNTPCSRFHTLPPGISAQFMAPDNVEELRQKNRQSENIRNDERLILFIGSYFKQKGLDRALRAVAALPPLLKEAVRLYVIGQNNPLRYRLLSKRLGIAKQICFLGAQNQNEIVRLAYAADLLLHPARREAGGSVLLEALAAGVPVLTTENCGFACHVELAEAGTVISAPFIQENLNKALQYSLENERLKVWRKNAVAYGRHADLYSRAEKAADMIEQLLRN